ncbi:hypothetical protein GCM10025779_31080 [Arthrobacter cryoconiti]
MPCESLQLLPQEILYIGDNYRTDIEGVRSAGLLALHLNRIALEQDAHTLGTLAVLPKLLEVQPLNFFPGRS